MFINGTRSLWNADWCAEYDMENSAKHPPKESQQGFLEENIIPSDNYIDTLLAQACESKKDVTVTCSAVTYFMFFNLIVWREREGEILSQTHLRCYTR